jgi:hypothetical protein
MATVQPEERVAAGGRGDGPDPKRRLGAGDGRDLGTDAFDRSRALRGVATMLARAGRSDRAGDVLRTVEATVRAIPNPNDRFREVRALARALAQLGDVDRALAVVRSTFAGHGLNDGLAEIAEALVDVGRRDRAAEVLDEVRIIPVAEPDMFRHQRLVTAMVRSGRLDRAVAVAGSVTQDWRRNQVHVDVTRAMITEGHLDRAAEVLAHTETEIRALDDPDPMLIGNALMWIAQQWIKAGRPDRAADLLRETEDVATAIDEADERIPLLGQVTRTLVHAGQYDRAEALCHRHGFWAALVIALADVGDADQALPSPGRTPRRSTGSSR